MLVNSMLANVGRCIFPWLVRRHATRLATALPE
uniref:Uncharacterized protein n=1 Tax=Anguilla anguilla TaxID=7936 RepID=A0A0E9SPE6_ANGAN